MTEETSRPYVRYHVDFSNEDNRFHLICGLIEILYFHFSYLHFIGLSVFKVPLNQCNQYNLRLAGINYFKLNLYLNWSTRF